MIISKKYLKTKDVCKVTFKLSKEEAQFADSVSLLGSFNNWDKKSPEMTKLKDGSFKTIVELEPGQSYPFRYLMNGEVWENDWSADAYEPTNVCEQENSIVIV